MAQVRLPSGRNVEIRPIGPGDASALKLAYDQLSPQAKYSRFLAPKPHLSRDEVRYLVDVDGRSHIALVATPIDDPQTILGVARLVSLPEGSGTAEFAVVVGDRFQREGLATELLHRIAQAAEAVGVRRVRATMLAENLPAHALMQTLAGERVHRRHDGPVDEVEIELTA